MESYGLHKVLDYTKKASLSLTSVIPLLLWG